MKKKCTRCGEIKSLTDYYTEKRCKSGYQSECKKCAIGRTRAWKDTEKGYLCRKYINMNRKDRKRINERHLSLDELVIAFEKHKSIYGMKSAWGPGPDQLDQHLPITMIHSNKPDKKAKKNPSNLSIDRLDPNKQYTLQNIKFIRGDENSRKKNTTYEDCKIQIKLHEERFINMKAI